MLIQSQQLEDGTWMATGYICKGYGPTQEEALADLREKINELMRGFKEATGFDMRLE